MGFFGFLKSNTKEKVEDFFQIDIHDIFRYNPEYLGEEKNDIGSRFKKHRLMLNKPELSMFSEVQINEFGNNDQTLIFVSKENVLSKDLKKFISFCTNKFGLDDLNEGEITERDIDHIQKRIFSRMWTKNNVWVDNNSNGEMLLTLFSVKMRQDKHEIPSETEKEKNAQWQMIGEPKYVKDFGIDPNCEIAQDAYNIGKSLMIDRLAKERVGIPNDCNNVDLGTNDPLLEEAAYAIVNSQMASTSLIQRKFAIGYNRAGRIMDQLEAHGIVGSFNGTKIRDVLIKDEYELEKILFKDRLAFADCSLSFKVGELEQFIFENKDAIDAKVEFYLRAKEQEEEIEKERQRQLIEEEKERIKQEILEKKRKKELRKIALQELQEEGVIENVKKREPIPQEIQDIVWNRDGGRCVKCGSRENLEFDHIIPFSKGGSNTARNLQLLCEKCNREKSNSIG